MKKKIALAAATLAVASLALTGCDKLTEPFNDAPIAAKHDDPAEVHSMPDGFSNVAEKCDGHGHRIYVAYHSDSAYAALAVVSDPSCAK